MVGATAAYALVMRGVGREIVLVDKNEARAVAEADDIRHAVPFAHPLEVRAGGYPDQRGFHGRRGLQHLAQSLSPDSQSSLRIARGRVPTRLQVRPALRVRR